MADLTCNICLKGKHIGCRGCACRLCGTRVVRRPSTRARREPKPPTPEARRLPDAMRDAILQGLVKDGLTEKECARRAGCSPRLVRRIYDDHRFAHLK